MQFVTLKLPIEAELTRIIFLKSGNNTVGEGIKP
jgi:hypothetical protein